MASESGPACAALRLLRFDFGLILRLANHEVARRLRDLGIGLELRLLAFLQRLRRFDLGVAVRLGFADGRIALDFRCPPLAERVEVLLLVGDFLDREHVDAEPHLLEVHRRFARELLREALTVAVHFLDGQRAEDGSQMAFERLEDHLLNLIVRHAEETLGRRLQRRIVAADLHVRHGLDRDRHALQRVRPLDLERDRHHVEVQVLDLLEQRDAQRGAASYHPVADDAAIGQFAPAAAQHRDRVRRHLEIVAADEPHRREETEQDRGDERGQPQVTSWEWHMGLVFSVV